MKNVIGRITISGENTIRSKRFGGRMRSKAPGRVKKTGKVMEMASRLFQSIVLQMKDTVDRTIGIVDASGAVVACTDLPRIGEMREEAITELGFAGEIVRFGGYTYHTTGDRASRLEYAVFVQGEDELARSIEYLRESLDQIAAGREGGKREEPSSRQTEKEGLQRAKKELKPEDLKLLGDILQEYLT